jgi:hypothetical protein
MHFIDHPGKITFKKFKLKFLLGDAISIHIAWPNTDFKDFSKKASNALLALT